MAMTASERRRRWKENKKREKQGLPPLPKPGTPGFDADIGTRSQSPMTAADLELPLKGGAGDAPHSPLGGASGAARPSPMPRARRGGGADPRASETPDAASATGAGGGNPKRRRGGSAPTADDIKLMTTQVFGAHQIMAGITGIPELAISPDDAKMLTEQSYRTAEAFGLDNIMQSKWWALGSLAFTAGAIYWPRFNHLAQRMANEAARQAEARTVDAVATPVGGNGAAPQSDMRPEPPTHATPANATAQSNAPTADMPEGAFAEQVTH